MKNGLYARKIVLATSNFLKILKKIKLYAKTFKEGKLL